MQTINSIGILHKGLCFWMGVFSFAGCLSSLTTAASVSSTPHPLDPLGPHEITAAVQLLKANGKVDEESRFSIIVLREPAKEEVLNFKPGSPMRREAFAVVYERAANKTFEAVVDLNKKSVLSWKEIPGVQASRLLEEMYLNPEVVRSDPRWQEAMKKRGITDFENVAIDPWGAGNFGFPEEQGIRVARAVSFYKGSSKNYYARPIEGVVAFINLNTMKVFKVVDSGVVPVPKAAFELDVNFLGKLRNSPKPLQIVQPQGGSFEVQGHEVRWQNWRFRFATHPRDGLLLYTVGYEDQGKLRPVLYRAALSEMVVPYGDPDPAWFFRNAFDQGEDGIGRFANSLEPGTDCPTNATFFDATFLDDKGTPIELARAIALYERDGGLLWKHSFGGEQNESRRARELVLGWIATVGNYEYGFNWVFHQDGTLEMEVLLTGIMNVKGVKPRTASAPAHEEESHGHRVAENLVAVHHQHFFNFRIDLDVDGASGNSVVEQNIEPVPSGPANPYGAAFVMKETLLRNEQEGQRLLNLASSRKWKVINPSVKNALGQPVGYMLVPGENSVPYANPESSVRKRAGFTNFHLWVSPYDPSQTNAAGYYIHQNKGGEGLPKWTMANRSIENQDIVLWYTMGITHIPRPEEWPVMTVHRAGFKLVPSGFFSRNPALDVPRP